MGNTDGVAMSLVNQGEVLAKQGKSDEGLHLTMEAYQLAADHGLTFLAQQIKPILDEIRSQRLR